MANKIDVPWMIYGANGYTGRLIAVAAVERGYKPILAGRNRGEVEALARELGLVARVFPCADENLISRELTGVKLVLHCAGPFSATASPMVKACMAAKAHYLDITGEIAVFEKIHSRTAEIAKSGITAIPGVGFDVVPSDCLALMLKDALPDATELELILKPSGGFSPGTMKTMVEGFYVGTVVRLNGKIELLNRFERAVRPFQGRERTVLGIAWGDVSTAYYSTGIPNVRVFLIASPSYARFLGVLQKFKALWKLKPMQALLKAAIEWKIQGPGVSERSDSGYQLWGIARNAAGKTVQMGIATTNGYTFTVDSALAAVERVLTDPPAPGALTPSRAFGKDFALAIPGTKLLASSK